MNAAAPDPIPTEKRARRLNQAIVDLTGDQYFASHPFFVANQVTVSLQGTVRLAEVLEDVARRLAALESQAPAAPQVPGQLTIDFS